MVNFLAEIVEKFEAEIFPTPLDKYKQQNIYYIDINEYPTDSYWTDWGGHYNSFLGTQIALYYEQYLLKVSSIQILLSTPNSLYIEDRIVYMNIQRHTWLYPDYSTSFEKVIPFLSSPINADNPSYNIIRETQAHIRLQVPSVNVKLSDNIAGITLNQGFSLDFANNDGFFDDDNKMNLFNTPIYLKKSVAENPEYSDFKLIRVGLIENTSTSFDNFQINVSDKFKSLEESVCATIKRENFPNISIDEQAIDKPIPIIYGTKRIKLIKLNNSTYLTAGNAVSVGRVFDRNGNTISATFNADKTITTSSDADEAEVTGNTNNRIGQIIQDIMTRTDFLYNEDNYNLTEFNRYASSSPRINLVISSGNVRKGIEAALKSDLAFFIQQSDGKFTIRKYGEKYAVRDIPTWSLTKKLEKSYSNAHENYFSSCIINFNHISTTQYSSLLYSDREQKAENTYRRIILKTFATDLVSRDDALALANKLSDRYTRMRQTLRIAVGIDTSTFELMDTVTLNTTINERKFNNITNYLIKEINPAQDILVLEEI